MKSIYRTSQPSLVAVVVRIIAALSLVVVSAAGARAQDLFNNTNTGGVGNGPSNATTFSLSSTATIREIQTYHWNFGRGAQPGSIALRAQNGRIYGPFSATAASGFRNAANVNWIAPVNQTLPAGTYTVLDSDPSTWSQNPQSGGRGFAIVRGTLNAIAVPPGVAPISRGPVTLPSCAVSPVYIRNLRYDDYTPYVALSSGTVALGGFIQISTRCLVFDGRLVVTLQDAARGNGFGVTAFQLTNVTVSGTTITAQVPNLAIFANRTFHVAVFVFGNPRKTANAGPVTIQ